MPEVMSGRCESCRHWDQKTLEGDFPLDPDLGICDLTWLEDIPHAEDLGGETGGEPMFPAGRLAMARDGSDYKAYLITRKDFGCVQFEAKPIKGVQA